ncbi:MAG: hypothetical protein ACD_24C00499G0003 [uncultured bacterium]|nr:MAG: hypothetical protein ACD_24C00499G0003 [uncultured bacterium]
MDVKRRVDMRKYEAMFGMVVIALMVLGLAIIAIDSFVISHQKEIAETLQTLRNLGILQ